MWPAWKGHRRAGTTRPPSIGRRARRPTDGLPAGRKGSQLLPILNSGRINLFGFNTPRSRRGTADDADPGKVLEREGLVDRIRRRVSKRDLCSFRRVASRSRSAPRTGARSTSYISSQIDAGCRCARPGRQHRVDDPNVNRNVWAVYGELNIPIIKTLEANVAVRFDDYENVGNTTNPKCSLRWHPTRGPAARHRAERASARRRLTELFQPASFGATGGNYDDPLRCPLTGSPRDCNAQFTTQARWQYELKPEKSTNCTAGIVLEPVAGFSFGVDYYNIKIEDVIGIPAETPIFSDIVASEAAGLIVRYAPGSRGLS